MIEYKEKYIEFNKSIHDYYFNCDNILNDRIIFNINESTLSNCTQDINSVVKYISNINDWEKTFLKYIEFGIPYYLGLLAVQVYVASQMSHDEKYNINNYNSRFRELINIKDDNALEKLYKNAQEKLWKEFEQYCHRQDQIIIIPPQRENKGRYIQYPISQATINTENEKKLIEWFKQINLKPNSNISYKNFSHKLIAYDLLNEFKIIVNDKDDVEKCEAIKLSCYEFYLHWNGGDYDVITRRKNKSIKTEYCFVITDAVKEFWVNNKEEFPLESEECMSCLYQLRSHHSNISYWIKNGDEFQHSKTIKFFRNRDYVFIIDNNDIDSINWFEHNFINNNEDACRLKCLNSKFKYFNMSSDLLIKLYELLKADKDYCFIKDFNEGCSFELIGGVKLGYSQWLKGAEPMILTVEGSTAKITINKMIVENNNLKSLNLNVGNYTISDGKYSKKIEIVSPKRVTQKGTSGWDYSKQAFPNPINFNECVISSLRPNNTQIYRRNANHEWLKSISNKGKCFR